MAAMFVAMVWHARRRLTAMEEAERVSLDNVRLLERERRFVQDASHELRTPITVALGHAELIQRQAPDPTIAEDAAVIADELMRLAATGRPAPAARELGRARGACTRCRSSVEPTRRGGRPPMDRHASALATGRRDGGHRVGRRRSARGRPRRRDRERRAAHARKRTRSRSACSASGTGRHLRSATRAPGSRPRTWTGSSIGSPGPSRAEPAHGRLRSRTLDRPGDRRGLRRLGRTSKAPKGCWTTVRDQAAGRRRPRHPGVGRRRDGRGRCA